MRNRWLVGLAQRKTCVEVLSAPAKYPDACVQTCKRFVREDIARGVTFRPLAGIDWQSAQGY